MAVDIERQITFNQPLKRHWWQRVLTFRDAPLIARGYLQTGAGGVPALTTASPLYLTGTGLLPADAQVLLLTAENATVRYMFGEAPTSTWGNPLTAGSAVKLTLKDPDILAVCAGAANAVLNIQAFAIHHE